MRSGRVQPARLFLVNVAGSGRDAALARGAIRRAGADGGAVVLVLLNLLPGGDMKRLAALAIHDLETRRGRVKHSWAWAHKHHIIARHKTVPHQTSKVMALSRLGSIIHNANQAPYRFPVVTYGDRKGEAAKKYR